MDKTALNAQLVTSHNLGRKILHSGSRNHSNLHFEFAILIRKNKCDHLGLLFYVLSFIQYVRKNCLNCRVSSTKLYAHEMFGSREFRTIFSSRSEKYLGAPAI